MLNHSNTFSAASEFDLPKQFISNESLGLASIFKKKQFLGQMNNAFNFTHRLVNYDRLYVRDCQLKPNATFRESLNIIFFGIKLIVVELQFERLYSIDSAGQLHLLEIDHSDKCKLSCIRRLFLIF